MMGSEANVGLKSKLPVRIYELLQKVGIDDPELILLKSDAELRSLAPFTSKDINILRSSAAEIVLGKNRFLTASEVDIGIESFSRKLSSGCPLLNYNLGGGFSCRGITEISGESRTGKTQFCLQLSLIVQFPEELGGYNSGAVFICTEDAFPSKRLQQLFVTFPRAFCARFNIKNRPVVQFADNIYIEHASDTESLVNIITKNLPVLLVTKKIGLIVIDSVGAVFRLDPVSPQRSNMMRAMAMELHRMAKKYGITVICVNQVSSSLENNRLVPCLGLSWANLVTTRIQLFRSNSEKPDTRTMQVVFAPDIPQNKVQYLVNENGVQGLLQ